MIELEVQKYHNPISLCFPSATQVADFKWEVEVECLFELFLELKKFEASTEKEALVKRRLQGAVRMAMRTTEEWKTPQWEEYQKAYEEAQALKAQEEEEERKAKRWRNMCHAQAHANWQAGFGYNAWR